MSDTGYNVDLHQVLEDYGYTQNIRDRYKDNTLFSEIGSRLMHCEKQLQFYRVGSFVEATKLPVESDIDMIALKTCIIAFDERSHCSYHKYETETEYVTYVKMVKDQWTRPGLTKLVPHNDSVLKTSNDTFSIRRDISGRNVLCFARSSFCKSNLPLFDYFDARQRRFDISGPAIIISVEGRCSMDIVLALSCARWPLCAQSWLCRLRSLKWLGKKEMQRLANMQCILVPTGHHESNLEWRISFSFQERELFWKLTDVQYKCFMLVKYVKQTYFVKEQKVKENSLTSYHCKTALYYATENNPGIWTRDSLMKCTITCFRLLLTWVAAKHCPSYFVPTVNLFSKLGVSEIDNLRHFLEDVLSDPICHISKGIQMMIDLHEHYVLKNTPIIDMLRINKTPIRSMKFFESLDLMYRELTNILGYIFRNVLDSSLSDTICYLTRELNVKYEYFKMVQTLIFPYIHTTLACHIVIKAVGTKNLSERNVLFLVSAFHFWKGLKFDTMSSKLKLVTVLIYTGHLDSAVAQLKEMSMIDTQSFLFGCSCVGRLPLSPDSILYLMRMQIESLSTEDLIQRHFYHCVMFLPTEIELTPYPLRFEMFRSVGVPLDAVQLFHYWWFRCAVMHPESYMHLLLHLTGTSLPKEGNAPLPKEGNVYQSPFETTANKTQLHYHAETILNVNGWLTERSGHYSVALNAYLSSWLHLEPIQSYYRVFPLKKQNNLYLHNAAKWHIVILLYRIWCNRKYGAVF